MSTGDAAAKGVPATQGASANAARTMAALRALLEQEWDAARRADVDALIELQNKKQELVDELKRSGKTAGELESLTADMNRNLSLMRHMVDCMRGLVQVGDPQTYTSDGQQVGGAGALRGKERGRL